MIRSGILIFMILLTTAGTFTSCRSVRESARFFKCEFKTRGVSKLNISGINILEKRSAKDFKIEEGLYVASQVKKGLLITDVTIDVQVANPNDKPASLEGLQYVLVIDGKEIINKELKTTMEIPAQSSKVFSVNSSFNLLKIAKDTGYDTILKLAMSMVDKNQQPVALDFYVRPYIRILGKKVKYPDFIKLSPDYRSGSIK